MRSSNKLALTAVLALVLTGGLACKSPMARPGAAADLKPGAQAGPVDGDGDFKGEDAWLN